MSNLLWVLTKWPFPADDGSKVASSVLIREMSRLGHEIDLLALVQPSEKIDFAVSHKELGFRSAMALTRKEQSKDKLGAAIQILQHLLRRPFVPITMRSFSTTLVRQIINRAMEGTVPIQRETQVYEATRWGTRWDALVYDGLHPAIHSSRIGTFRRPNHAPRLIYRAHNHETDIWSRNAAVTTDPLLKWILLWQARQVARFEHSVVRGVDATAPVSADDLEAFKESVPEFKGRVVSIGYQFAEPLAFPPAAPWKLLFLGRLDWPPNRDGLVWFLKNVWPTIREKRKDLVLVIAGSGRSEFLLPYLEDSNVQFLGRVPDVEKVYQDSVAALVPIFYGSGTRVKAIEACRFGRACVSTAMGVEGIGLIPGQSYFCAETAEQWIHSLLTLDPAQAREFGLSAYHHAKSRFDAPITAKEFEVLIKS